MLLNQRQGHVYDIFGETANQFPAAKCESFGAESGSTRESIYNVTFEPST